MERMAFDRRESRALARMAAGLIITSETPVRIATIDTEIISSIRVKPNRRLARGVGQCMS